MLANDHRALSGMVRAAYASAMDRRSWAWEEGDAESVVALTDFACALAYAMEFLGAFRDDAEPVSIDARRSL